MALTVSLPAVYLGIHPTSPIGVALAAYTGQLSRMWAWDAKSFEIIGYQDVKGRGEFLDLSPDGNHIAYYIQNFSKRCSYIGVSRPPFFHALLLMNSYYNARRLATFESEKSLVVLRNRFDNTDWHKNVPERLQRKCPYKVQDFDWDHRNEDFIYQLSERLEESSWARCGQAFPETLNWPGAKHGGETWTGQDCKKRKIWSDGRHVYADETPFLDLARQPFTEVVPPEWAKTWIAPRPK